MNLGALSGYTIGITADRRWQEQAELLERRGARIQHGPSIRTFPLFDEAGHTKRDLVDYLDAVRPAILPALAGRALSVVRVRPGQQPFMQKNLPRYAPDWIVRTTVWAEASHREIAYPLCDDRRTLLWLANQRAVEYHPALIRAGERHTTHWCSTSTRRRPTAPDRWTGRTWWAPRCWSGGSWTTSGWSAR